MTCNTGSLMHEESTGIFHNDQGEDYEQGYRYHGSQHDDVPLDGINLDDGDDDDEVIREIDVFLSPALSHKTYLMQYPGQPESNDAPDATAATATPTNRLCVPIEARIKPRHGLVHAEHSVSAALSATPYGSSSMRTFESQTIPVTTHLCLGKLVLAGDGATAQLRDAFHLVPLTHITQMRPSFFQFDEGDQNTATTGMDDGKDEESAKARQQQPIGFTRKESDRAAAARKSSYAYKRTSQEAEAWIDLTVAASETDAPTSSFLDAFPSHIATADVTANVRSQIMCPAPQHVIWSRSPEDGDAHGDHAARYIKTLNYIPPSTAYTDTTGISHANILTRGVENASLLKAVIAKTTIILQQTGGPVPFSILLGPFGSTGSQVTAETLLRALNVCAVLVRGNWCLHSKFLQISALGHRKASMDRTASTASLQQMRTFLLLLLQDEGVIDRPRLLRAYDHDASMSNSSTPQRITSLLQLVAKRQTVMPGSIAVCSQRSGWVLKIDDDVEFLQQHPDVLVLHEAYWSRQRLRYARELELYRSALS